MELSGCQIWGIQKVNNGRATTIFGIADRIDSKVCVTFTDLSPTHYFCLCTLIMRAVDLRKYRGSNQIIQALYILTICTM